MTTSFGGRKPYFTEFEMSEDISPDPFADEALTRAMNHPCKKIKDRPDPPAQDGKTEAN